MSNKYSVGDILVNEFTNSAYFIFETFEVLVNRPVYYSCIVQNTFIHNFELKMISSSCLDKDKNIQKVGEDLQRAEQLRMLCDDIKFMLGKQIGLLSID